LTAKDATSAAMDSAVLNKLNTLYPAGWKKIVTDSMAATTKVTLDGSFAVTTIGEVTAADTTTTKTPTTNTITTSAPPYKAMTKIAGVLEMNVDESGCLNMQDASMKLADMIKTESKAPSGASVTVTTVCTDLKAVTMSYEIMTPTGETPTPTTMVTTLKAITPAEYTTKIKTSVAGAGTNPPWTQPTISGLKLKGDPTENAVTTTTGPTTTFTGSTTKGTKQEITGKLAFKVASKDECDKMGEKNGKDAIINMLATESGISKTDIAVTVTCSPARRLSDGRRLTAYNAEVGYKITVQAGSAVAASTVTTKLGGFDKTAWKDKLEKALKDAGTPVTITEMTVTAPKAKPIHDVSSAGMWTPMATIFLAVQFLL